MHLCSPVKVKAMTERLFQKKDFQLDILHGPSCRRENVADAHVGYITFHGAVLIAARDETSRHLAKLRASCILASIFSGHPEIVQELLKLSLSLQRKDNGKNSRKVTNQSQ